MAEARAELSRIVRGLDGLLPALSQGSAQWPGQVRIGDLVDAGLVRLDGERPRAVDERLDTDFLTGFLTAAANTRRSTSASGTYRTDARSARVSKSEPEQQRRYGAVFRALAEFEKQARELSALATRAAQLAKEGLTSGALAPEEDIEPDTAG